MIIHKTTAILLVFACYVFCTSSVAAGIPDDALMILQSRDIIGTVYFPASNSQINREGRKSIKTILPALVKNEKSKIIRAEGFFVNKTDATTAVRNSMMLAKTVRDYLAVNGIVNVYITGFGSKNYGKATSVDTNRVEIAIYDKLMDIDGYEVTQTIETLAAE